MKFDFLISFLFGVLAGFLFIYLVSGSQPSDYPVATQQYSSPIGPVQPTHYPQMCLKGESASYLYDGRGNPIACKR